MRKFNHSGVMDSSVLYRTFDGELYPQWASDWSQKRAKTYRAAGIRCHRVGEEVFVHHADQERARAIDATEFR